MGIHKFVPEGWNNEITKIDGSNIEKYIDEQTILQGIVKNCDDNYNLNIDFENGMKGIIPREEIEAINIEKNGFPKVNLSTGKVHKFVQFTIKENSDKENLVLSRRSVQESALKWVKNELTVGEKVDGIVKSIKPYGAFVEIGGGVVGIIHIEDLSVARIKSPLDRIKIGQKIEVVVKSVCKESGRVILSYKEMLGTWEENAKIFEEGTNVIGKIRETEKNKNGIFIELRPNLVGMAEYKEGYKYGQNVEVHIKKIDKQKKKIKLIIL